MKTIKLISIILLSVLLFAACEISEDPKFPSTETLFETEEGANTVLLGCYNSLASFNYYGADFKHLTEMSSGLFTTGKDANLKNIVALQVTPSMNYVENLWRAVYQSNGRASDVIVNMENSNLLDTLGHHPYLGQAYFIRALNYFNLVRIYGGVPLMTDVVTQDNMNLPRSSVEEVYTQIIADLNQAKVMMSDNAENGLPSKYAANMLLAKVYMQMAGNKTASETEYWQKAYDEAIQVHGEFNLLEDYADLWMETTSNNNDESIFEIQGNEENTLRLYQLYTPSNGNLGQSVWGRIKPNIECYTQHEAKYSGDPRIANTFLTEWTKYAGGKVKEVVTTYPTFTARQNKDKSYPFLYKYYIKDHTRLNYNTIMNFVVLRYADLLLMLSEIENELNGPDAAYQYVNEVLARARGNGTVPADWSGLTQSSFRHDIMFEYRFELLGEGHEWFNDRRRGYDYFKTNVIDLHNSHPDYDFTKSRDVELPDNSRNMLMPIPLSEITANPNVSVDDQNPGY